LSRLGGGGVTKKKRRTDWIYWIHLLQFLIKIRYKEPVGKVWREDAGSTLKCALKK
jgi:hypothetical protein